LGSRFIRRSTKLLAYRQAAKRFIANNIQTPISNGERIGFGFWPFDGWELFLKNKK